MSLDRFANCDTFHGCCLVSVVYLGANLAGFIERLAVAPLQAEILSHLSWTQAVNTLQKVHLTGHFIFHVAYFPSNTRKLLLVSLVYCAVSSKTWTHLSSCCACSSKWVFSDTSPENSAWWMWVNDNDAADGGLKDKCDKLMHNSDVQIKQNLQKHVNSAGWIVH